MNRPRQYDREEVLEKTTNLFWEKGFEATSMNEVVARTGLNKHSLYSEFGDKEGLFIDCIDYYGSNVANFIRDILAREPLGLSNIEAFFVNRVSYAASDECKGCLIFNSVTEKETLSNEINLIINSRVSKIKTLFYNCLKAAQKRKEISGDKDCKALANYLTCFTCGLVNFGKSGTNMSELKKIIDVALLPIRN